MTSTTLSQKARKRLGKHVPRERAESEALPVQVCNASQKAPYVTGAGEVVAPVRSGAMRAYSIPSRGIGA